MIKKAEPTDRLFYQAKELVGLGDEFTTLDCIVATDNKNKVTACCFYDIVKEQLSLTHTGNLRQFTSCVKRVIKEFTKLGINEVTCIIPSENTQLQQILEKEGFSFSHIVGICET